MNPNDTNNKDNITIGLPKKGGALYWAPLGTALPTNAKDSLAEAFVNLGYVTSDGVTLNTAEETSDIEAWGPETVMSTQTSYSKTATFNLLETCKEAVLQFVYGKENVKVQEDGSLEWSDTGAQLPRGVLVIDTLQNNGGETPRIKRQVLGDAQFVDRSGDAVYNNSDALSYPVSVKAYKFTPAEGEAETYIKSYLTAPITAASSSN